MNPHDRTLCAGMIIGGVATIFAELAAVSFYFNAIDKPKPHLYEAQHQGKQSHTQEHDYPACAGGNGAAVRCRG